MENDIDVNTCEDGVANEDEMIHLSKLIVKRKENAKEMYRKKVAIIIYKDRKYERNEK